MESIGKIHALAMEAQGTAHGGFLFEVKVPHGQESFEEASTTASLLRRRPGSRRRASVHVEVGELLIPVAELLGSAEDPDCKGNQLAQLLELFRCDPRSGDGLDPLLGDAAEL
jgi:hypothetical protein